MKRIVVIIIAAVAIALLYLGYTRTVESICCPSTAIEQPVAIPEQIITTVGKTITITLDENTTTGYSWRIAPWNREILEQTGSQSTRLAGTEHLAGAASVRVFTFKARKPGMVQLHMKYARPWEEGKVAPTERVYIVTVQGELK